MAQTIEDHPADNGMIGVKRVAGAAVVRIARAVIFQDVVGAVVQSTEAERRAVVIAFGSMVEDHVQNDLDSRPVQRLHHVAKLIDRAKPIPARAVGLVGRKEGDRRVTPIVDESRWAILRVELEYGQQFDGGDA